MYKGNSNFNNGSTLTDDVCLSAGFSFCNAIKTMKRKDKILVKATLLHPNEISAFNKLNGTIVNGLVVQTVNFK